MLHRFFVSLIVLAFCLGAPLAAQPTDKVVAAHYPPLMVANDRERPGYALEILKEAARRAGRNINITFLPFERAIFEVQNDPATLMPSLFKGKARDDLFLWVIDISMAELRFAAVNASVNDLDAARALPTIVLENGTTGDTLLTKLGFDNVMRLHDPEASARMLQSGRATAWFLTQSNMQRVWSAIGAQPPLTFGDVVHEVPISIVASPTLPPETKAAYRDAVQSMYDDGTLVDIIARYEAL